MLGRTRSEFIRLLLRLRESRGKYFMHKILAPWILWAMLLFPQWAGLRLTSLPPQDQCIQDDACHAGECAVYEHGRWACTPRQYTMAVWDRTCLDTITFTEESRMEAPIGDDGKPDMDRAKVTKTKTSLTKGCQFRYEVRARSTQ